MAAEIVARYLGSNRLAAEEIPQLVRSVHAALATLGQAPQGLPERAKPTAAQVRGSIREDALVSFLDGKPYKLLKRHLTNHGMTPAEYRERFGLRHDYPMTAPAYSAMRSKFAKDVGLGRTGRAARRKKMQGHRRNAPGP
jgi:predicted transcriptional regulator